MRTGDLVRHIPSGETWTVAWADEYMVICCGWPETMARVSLCELVTAASDEEHLKVLHEVAAQCGGQTRGRRCQAELDRLRSAQPSAIEGQQ